MFYVGDTNLFIEYYRKSASAKLYFEKLKSGEISLGISAISEAEIWVGIKDEKQLRYWIVLLDLIESIEVDSEIARKAGELYRDFGHYMGKTSKKDLRFMGDAFIAATAIVKQAKLLTGNYKHFKQLENRNLLSCETYEK